MALDTHMDQVISSFHPMESLADLYLHFDARRVVGVKPPHTTGARAGIPVPSGGGYGGFSLSDGAAATCSWRYGFAGRPSNGSHGGSAWRGRLFLARKNMHYSSL